MAVQVDEGKKQALDLRLDPNEPSLDLEASQHVFTSSDTPGVHIHGFVPQSELTVTITRLDAERIAEAGGLNATFTPLNGNTRELGPDHYGKLVTTMQKPLKKDVEGFFTSVYKCQSSERESIGWSAWPVRCIVVRI